MTLAAPEVRSRLVSSRFQLLEIVRDLSLGAVATRPEPREWSILEVLAHMIDVDYFYLGQAMAMKDHEAYLFQYFDDDA